MGVGGEEVADVGGGGGGVVGLEGFPGGGAFYSGHVVVCRGGGMRSVSVV